MNNLTGISYSTNIASLDGLCIVQADALYVDGVDIDGAAYVKKAGDTMSGTLNMGTNPVKTSYAPLVGQDVANKQYVDSAISGSGYVPYTGATSNVNLNTKSITAGDIIIAGNSYLGSGSATNYVSIVGPTTMEKESDINQKPDSTDHVLVLRSTTASTTTAPTLVVDTDYVHNVCSIQAKAYNNSAVLPLLLQYSGGETQFGGNTSITGTLTISGAANIGTRLLGNVDGTPTGNFWIGLRGTGTEAQRLAIAINGNSTTGVVSNVTINKPLIVTGTITNTGIITGTPSYTVGVDSSNNLIKYANPTSAFTGTVDATYIPYASSTNVLADSLMTQNASTITINGALTTTMGFTDSFGEVTYVGINPITTGTPTTTGLTVAAPASGSITYSAPTYTLTFTTQYMGCMWSSATFVGSTRRYFFTFTNLSWTYNPGGATLTICQANTANTAYTALTSAFPLVAGTMTNYFVPNYTGYSGQIFLLFTGAKFGSVSWNTFSYGRGSDVVQGDETLYGLVKFPNDGVSLGPPTVAATPSAGTRIMLWDNGSASVPYSIGMEGNGLWFSSNRDFNWYSGSTTVTRQMSLQNGNLSIGTGTPNDALTVQATAIATPTGTSAYCGIHIQPSTTSGNADYYNGITWSGNDSGNTNTHAGILVQGSGAYGTKMRFYTTDSWTDGQKERMVIDSTGRVGIGIASPTTPLDVQGIVRMGNWTGGNYDNINFARTSSGVYPNINCSNNYMFMYVTNAGGWITSTSVGDMGMLAQGHNIHLGTGTTYAGLIVDTSGYVHLNYVPQNDWQYGTRALCLDSNGRIAYGSSVGKTVTDNNYINWGGGVNYTYAFYRHNAYVNVSIRIRYSMYMGSVGIQYPYIRIYSQAWGQYWYYSPINFQNITYAHTTFEYEINLNVDKTSSTGWYDIYVYNGSNCITDSNDQLMIWTTTSSGSNY